MRRSSLANGAIAFRAPRLSGAADDAASPDAAARPSVGIAGLAAAPAPIVAARRSSGGSREVFYPNPIGRSEDEASRARLSARMDKRREVDYHQPEPKKKVTTAEVPRGDDGELVRVPIADAATPSAAAVALANSLPLGAVVRVGDAADGDGDEESTPDVIVRLPASSRGMLYFQVETDGATRHESVGIVIIDTVQEGIQMFDRLGRQHGNREDPGYPLKTKEIEEAQAGKVLKVGTKSVTLVTALKEEAFRSGEFFLRSEHQQRKRDESKKAKLEAAAAEEKAAAKPRMSFGSALLGSGPLFAAKVMRRRPEEGSTGFIVPVLGRPKRPGEEREYKALHDHDRENAVVLFRADYKRDANGKHIVSVVVDPVVGDKLRPHQRVGVKFLFDCVTGERMPGYFGAILADEMGLGKTVQTVATVYTCLKQGKHGIPVTRKALVVAPSSLVRNWCNEFDKWLGEGAVKYFSIGESTPKGDRILSRFESEGDVLVISYDQLRKYVDRLSKCKAIDLVVCDEGHKLKNAEIKTTKAVDMLPTRRRIILSGTPIQNDLTEFHAMVGFVNPGILGNRDLFGRVFEEPIMHGRDPDTPEHLKELGADRAHYLANLTQMFILRRTQTINEKYLPAKVDCTVFCRLGEEQAAAYQRIANLASTGLASTPLVLITAMKKLCNHMDLLADAVRVNAANKKDGDERAGLPPTVLPKGFKAGQLSPTYGAKLAFVSFMLDELVTNGDRDKLVIVSNYTQTLDIIARLCQVKKVAFFQLDGTTPIKKRQELVDMFNFPQAAEIVFLLSSKAGGVGLNLVGANRLILFDPDWNPANDAQAMGRVWRDGQKKKVFIYRLLSSGTIEEKVYQRQVSKQGLSANVVDMKEDSKQHFTLDELKALFAYRPDTPCDTHDLLGCKCHVPLTEKAKAALATGFRKVGGPPKSGPRMDELKSWQHVSDARTFALDKVMQRIATKDPRMISFLFANERDAKKIEVDVEPERAFQQDEGKITKDKDSDDELEVDIVESSDSEDGDDSD